MFKTGRHVLILGLDGIRGDCLTAAHREYLISAFGKGFHNFSAQTSRLTVSDPAWTSALTGRWPSAHGVETDFAKWDHDACPSLFRVLKKVQDGVGDAQKGSTVTSSGSEGPLHTGIVWTQWAPLVKAGLVTDPIESRYFASDPLITANVVDLLRPTGSTSAPLPLCLFVHLDDVDHAGHDHGFLPTSVEYRDAITATLSNCECIRRALEERLEAAAHVDEDWLVVVTTDHGGGVAWSKDHGDDCPAVRTIFLLGSRFTNSKKPDGAATFSPPHPVSQITDVFNLTLHWLLDPLTAHDEVAGVPRKPHSSCTWSHPSGPDEADYSHHLEWAYALNWWNTHHAGLNLERRGRANVATLSPGSEVGAKETDANTEPPKHIAEYMSAPSA